MYQLNGDSLERSSTTAQGQSPPQLEIDLEALESDLRSALAENGEDSTVELKTTQMLMLTAELRRWQDYAFEAIELAKSNRKMAQDLLESIR